MVACTRNVVALPVTSALHQQANFWETRDPKQSHFHQSKAMKLDDEEPPFTFPLGHATVSVKHYKAEHYMRLHTMQSTHRQINTHQVQLFQRPRANELKYRQSSYSCIGAISHMDFRHEAPVSGIGKRSCCDSVTLKFDTGMSAHVSYQKIEQAF